MRRNLYAMHDYDAAWGTMVAGAGRSGWGVMTHGIGSDPNEQGGYDYSGMVTLGITPIARLNNGYEPNGTIPLPGNYPQFAARCANWVSGSRQCVRWIIGNEPNLIVERPQGVPIKPAEYARCFIACRNQIKLRGLQHQVIIAAIGPWNVQTGDWIAYQQEMMAIIAANGGADGIAIHTYTRSDNPADIISEAKMNAPGYTNRYNNFYAYKDLMAAIPMALRNLPVYLTEFNEIQAQGWTDANTGVVKAAYREIDEWNSTPGNQTIFCLALFRWEIHDGQQQWSIKDRAGVQADFRDSLAFDYGAPLPGNGNGGSVTPPPAAGGDGPTPPTPPSPILPREVDPRLTQRGVEFVDAQVAPGKGYWHAKRARWYNEQEADSIGPDHHILGEIKRDGVRAVGVPFAINWDGGNAGAISKANPNDAFNYDWPMTKSLNEFSIRVADGAPSDQVTRIGMGADGNSGIHTSTWIDWEWKIAQQATAPSTPTTPTPPINPDEKGIVPPLVHPIGDPALRQTEQGFGSDPDYYKQFAVDGVPLKGHNGLDFAVPVGTPVRAVADGVVREAWNDPSGYGNLVLLDHSWGQSLYAHLDGRFVEPGDTVNGGEVIGRSGATGKVTGPHLHYGMRVFPYSRQDGWGGYTDPQPYLENTVGGNGPVTPANPGLIDPKVAAAILDVESRGQAYGPDGRMTVRFEPHIFKPKVPAETFDQHFKIGSPIWDGDQHQFLDPDDGQWKQFHGNQPLEYKALSEAIKLNREGAYQALGMGMGQVMGFNAQRVGFENAEQMYQTLNKSAPAQMMAFVNFVLSDPALLDAIRAHDFEKVAELYNGSGNVEAYAKLMRDAYAHLA